MVIFIDDRPIRIVKKKELGEIPSKVDFDLVIDARLSPLKVENFSGHTCIINASIDQVEKIKVQMKTIEKGFEMNDEMTEFLEKNPEIEVQVDIV